MFQKARYRLTLWYVIIALIISGVFSAVIYFQFSNELGKGLRIQSIPLEKFGGATSGVLGFSRVPSRQEIEKLQNQILAEARGRILLNLLAANALVGLLAAGAGYFLADKTLQPLERMLEEQRQFTADASHELRTPLTALKTTIEVGMRDKGMTLSQAKELLKSNLEEVDKLRNLTSHLLHLNRHDNDTIEAFEDIPAQELFEAAASRLSRLIEKRNASVEFNGGDIALHGSRDYLVDLLSILIDNAIKYSPDQPQVNVSVRRVKSPNENVVLSVRDRGSGIARHDLPHIFNRFYRANHSRSKDEADGFGLGLSMVKRIAHLHNADIRVKSELGKGTTFSVIFPSV